MMPRDQEEEESLWNDDENKESTFRLIWQLHAAHSNLLEQVLQLKEENKALKTKLEILEDIVRDLQQNRDTGIINVTIDNGRPVNISNHATATFLICV